EDRAKVFREVRRVGKPGGRFFFSTHNLQYMRARFDLRRSLRASPRKALRNVAQTLAAMYYNRALRLSTLMAPGASHAVLNDGVHSGRLRTYYVSPQEQVEQLAAYFDDIKVYGLAKGEVVDAQDWYQLED